MKKISFVTKHFGKSYQDRFGGTMLNALEKFEWFQEVMQQELYRGYPVYLPMIGKFTAYIQKERLARNPKTGDKVVIKSRYSCKFKASESLKRWLNKNR